VKGGGSSRTMALPSATVKWKPSTFSIQFQSNNVSLFRLQRVKASFTTAQPGFYHCTNTVYHCTNEQWHPHILDTVSDCIPLTSFKEGQVAYTLVEWFTRVSNWAATHIITHICFSTGFSSHSQLHMCDCMYVCKYVCVYVYMWEGVCTCLRVSSLHKHPVTHEDCRE